MICFCFSASTCIALDLFKEAVGSRLGRSADTAPSKKKQFVSTLPTNPILSSQDPDSGKKAAGGVYAYVRACVYARARRCICACVHPRVRCVPRVAWARVCVVCLARTLTLTHTPKDYPEELAPAFVEVTPRGSMAGWMTGWLAGSTAMCAFSCRVSRHER